MSPMQVTHIMLFGKGDLYGEEVRIDFIRRLRGVERFDSLQALVDQMKADGAQARDVLEGDASPN